MTKKCVDCLGPHVGEFARCDACRAVQRERNRLRRATVSASRATFDRAGTVAVNVRRPLTSGQVSRILGVAPKTAAKWIDSGALKGYRMPESGDRRVATADLVAFMRDRGIEVPAELKSGVTASFGMTDAPLDYPTMDAFRLGALSSSGPITALLVGDCDGLEAAASVGAAVRGAHPAAGIVLLLDPANAGFVPPAGVFDRVVVRPCDLAAVARELVGETPDGVP